MNYLIPANTKNGNLIFNVFTGFDLGLFLSGIGVSLLLLLIISPGTLLSALICLAPGLICSMLVVPVPNYHNILTVLKEMISFFNGRRNYKWKGWCYTDEYK